MRIKWLLFYILALSISCCRLQAQTKTTDSIRQVIYSTNNTQQKLSAIFSLCDQYQSLNRDTAYNYAVAALGTAKNMNDKSMIARAELALANAYSLWGWVDSANAVCESALKKCNADDAGTRDVYFRLLRQKAMCYGGIQKFPEALNTLYQLLREAEQYKDSVTIASTCNTIGSVNMNMDKPGEAINWINKGLSYTTPDKRFLSVKAAGNTNMSLALSAKDEVSSAIQYINIAVPLCKEAQNLNTLAVALRVRSNLYIKLKSYKKAETDLVEMMQIRRLLSGSLSNLTDDNIQLAQFYASTNQLQKAIDLCKQNLKSGNIYTTGDSVSFSNHITVKLDYYKALAGFYKEAGMHNEYASTLEEIVAAKDSFYAANSQQALAEVQTRYETEQKEKIILQQKYDLTKQHFIIYGSIGLFILASFIFYLLFREYRRRQTTKMLAAMAAEKTARLIAVQEAEEKERKRIAADLHDNLGVQANAILYNSELLKSEFSNSIALVENLHDTARQMLLNLRETLWVMKSTEIDAAELWVRIINFCQQMSRHYSHIKFTTQGAAPQEKQLPSAKALNIVMIIQEAVQNAVKHSEADVITIMSQPQQNDWKIIIRDDGNGFALSEVLNKPDSFGIKNIKERAAASNMHITIGSYGLKGTSVELLVNETYVAAANVAV